MCHNTHLDVDHKFRELEKVLLEELCEVFRNPKNKTKTNWPSNPMFETLWTTSGRPYSHFFGHAPPYNLSGLKYRLQQRAFWDLILTLLVFHFIWGIYQRICITGTDIYKKSSWQHVKKQ